MKKILIIHPFDLTTSFLKESYKDLDCTVITESLSRKKLKIAIEAHDIIIMLGHGTESGLIGFGRFIINRKVSYKLKNKECYFIWCNADEFVHKNKLKGFHTGMFISEMAEADMYEISTTLKDISDSNKLFAALLNKLFKKDITINDLKKLYGSENKLKSFNQSRFYLK